MAKRAVVLLSGGLDSTTVLFWAQRRGYRPTALIVDYGQRHKREIKAARRVAKAAGAPWHEISLSLPWLRDNYLINTKKKLPHVSLARIGKNGIPPTYVPGRNTILLALGVSLADSIGAEAVIYGANALDYSDYPDCRPDFISAFSRAARLGTRQGAEQGRIRVLAPLSRLDKSAIVKLGRKLKAPLHITWSCYEGDARPCGCCDSCQLRAKGFAAAGVADPAQ
ncbi:MAG: 7-cyano-7-deazaguanine synthase QueC [Elusimicrobia bacterium RIFCSPHIGHO2_02_FULL_57_9]|nr:MAG: 7-cyano-7-deazaguanine synthase QueC [Elusimicrobia bacterium RIFCSPHIGHO2_02_FULL_57_9]